MKKTLEAIKAKEKMSEPQPEKSTPPEIKTQDSCHSKPREKNSEKETNHIFLEENILLKKENRELKERLIIMERVIDQILRDQEDKRIYTGQSGYEWETQTNRNQRIPSQFVRHNVTSRNEDFISHPTKRTPASNTGLFARSSIQDFSLKNKLEVLPESDDYEDDSSYSNRENKATRNNEHLLRNRRNRQAPGKQKARSESSGQAKNIGQQLRRKKVQRQSSAYEKKPRNKRGKTVILGDSQLHHIEENKLSSKTNKILVRSKGGLKVNEVIDTFGDILNEEADEFIIHVGVNSIEKESEEQILHKFLKLGESIDSARVTFSSIIKRADKPKLNHKIMQINDKLKNLCLENRYDFIDNINIGFRHLGRDKLHINKEGQWLLAINYLNHLRSF